MVRTMVRTVHVYDTVILVRTYVHVYVHMYVHSVHMVPNGTYHGTIWYLVHVYKYNISQKRLEIQVLWYSMSNVGLNQ